MAKIAKEQVWVETNAEKPDKGKLKLVSADDHKPHPHQYRLLARKGQVVTDASLENFDGVSKFFKDTDEKPSLPFVPPPPPIQPVVGGKRKKK